MPKDMSFPDHGKEKSVCPQSRARAYVLAELLVAGAAVTAAAEPRSPAILHSEFIDERAATASTHASTIVETREGMVAAWFGGTAEGHPDVGIWLARHDGARWSAPVEVAKGLQADGRRHPCWNPVLFRPSRGPLLLFYKVGPSPREWWGEVRTSTDDGRSWSAAIRLPPGILGPIRAKPVDLSGVLLAGSSTEDAGWTVHMERFLGLGADVSGRLGAVEAWTRTGPLNDPRELEAIQPTILVHTPSRLQILCRSRQGVIAEAWSEDGGWSWGRLTRTALPNPSAGIDAARLADGRFLLAYNPTATGRGTLEVAVSADGKRWRRGVVLEDSAGEFSYPALIQAGDGRVHVTYTWRRRRIKHVVIDPSAIR
jgi:predicted neuraminidase